ncbi:MAG: hypothetical protein ACKVQU_24820 [Burkholderiales bacterium]
MIPRLASPSVCVIDDEEEEYVPILDALMTLGLGCIHVRGNNGDPLPPKPFEALRLVFTDLHLSGEVGKTAASHTANVVKKVVSAECGPVLIVIWSKYAGDPAGNASLPPEDQPTEADLFKTELLSSEPKFKGRVAFAEMPKPKLPDRPAVEEWVKTLQIEIERVLTTIGAFEILWTWEALARDAGIEVSETLTKLMETNGANAQTLEIKLKLMLRLLAQQQGGPDSSVATAPRHLLTVFSQMGQDVLDAGASVARLEEHAEWLAEKVDDETKKKHRSATLNAVLLTSAAVPSFAAFTPGTVFDVRDTAGFCAATGFSVERLQRDCFEGDPDKSPAFAEFKTRTKPVLLEITPACDFHQGHRRCATLLAGLAFPFDLQKRANTKDACKSTPVFEDRYSNPVGDIGFVFCGRYRLTLPVDQHPAWLGPRLRLRDMLVTDIRNWHASQASRVGYLSF